MCLDITMFGEITENYFQIRAVLSNITLRWSNVKR